MIILLQVPRFKQINRASSTERYAIRVRRLYIPEPGAFACRIPPGVFIKLHQATWHAGPYFVDSQHMDFYNLELSDTNVTDHNTHVYKGVKVVIELEDC